MVNQLCNAALKGDELQRKSEELANITHQLRQQAG